MNIVKRFKSTKHIGCILVVIALLLAIPETVIALDADISTTPDELSAVNAAINNDENSVKAITLAITSSAEQTSLSDALKAEEKAKAEKEAKAIAETAAQKKVAEKKAAEKKVAEKTAAKNTEVKKATVEKSAPVKSTSSKSRSSKKSSSDKYGGRSVSTSFTVKAYAYTGGGTTASGMKAAVGRVAVDPRVIPLGTWLYIEGYGLCIAADTGGDIKGKTVDLYMNSESECRNWGVRSVTCYVLE
jgi:3D (Asp-Asp-Asp) domain-containing protein